MSLRAQEPTLKQKHLNWRYAGSRTLFFLPIISSFPCPVIFHFDEQRCAMPALVFLLQDVKKTMQQRNAPVQRTQHLGPDRAAQTKDGDVVDAEPASDASRARSIQRSGNASRKRVLRSRCNNPQSSVSRLSHMTWYRLRLRMSDRMPNVFQL
jgi:hypothetical protein